MTERLEQALQRVRALPATQQDELARVLLNLAGDHEDVYRLTAEEEADLTEAEAEMARGEFAADAWVEATFSNAGMSDLLIRSLHRHSHKNTVRCATCPRP